MRFSSALAVVLALGLSTSVQSFTLPVWSTAVTKPSRTTSKPTKEEIRRIQQQTEERIRQKHDNDAWNTLFVACPERPNPVPIIETEGTIPADFPPGSLLRLGPNGADAADGYFDGDGMVQCITFPPAPGQGTFSSTYIDTKGRQLEKATGKKFKGTLRGVPQGYPMLQSILENVIAFRTLQAQKDTCNTAIAQHGGRVLALMEQCPPTEIEIRRNGQVRTVEAGSSLDGAIDLSAPITGGVLSAHGRTCPITGDRVHVSYRSDEKPYLRMDVFSPGWALKESRGIDVPVPIFSHDCALTENYVVVLDLPLTLRVSRLFRNRFPVEYEPDHAARIGLVPRAGGETKWFDCKPGVVLHACNAWETKDGKVIIVQGFRGEPTPNECYLNSFSASYYYEYSIDLETGTVTEQTLNAEEIVEFPVINDKMTGRECAAIYAMSVNSVGGPLEVYSQPNSGATFDAVLKFAAIDTSDHERGDVIGRFQLPERWFAVSEPTVVPKVGKDGEGEYVLLIATQVPPGVVWQDVAKDYDGVPLKSKVFIVDGDNLDAGPVYSATLPHHVPYGLHSGFVDWKDMK